MKRYLMFKTAAGPDFAEPLLAGHEYNLDPEQGDPLCEGDDPAASCLGPVVARKVEAATADPVAERAVKAHAPQRKKAAKKVSG